QESRLPPGSDFRRWVWITIAPFVTVTNMKAGNSNLPNTMVPPKGEVSVDIPHAVTGDISFQTINDYGALTPRIKATMQ
ncbi:hypothetical protein LGN62_23665, partial [Escherichia coli]|nr:hypothetical protein [Escherichia coli]MCA8697906.1 hypothetical protein [Escherichia coli]MCA8702463.1 hypothetical protein [Escherichia coli]